MPKHRYLQRSRPTRISDALEQDTLSQAFMPLANMPKRAGILQLFCLSVQHTAQGSLTLSQPFMPLAKVLKTLVFCHLCTTYTAQGSLTFLEQDVLSPKCMPFVNMSPKDLTLLLTAIVSGSLLDPCFLPIPRKPRFPSTSEAKLRSATYAPAPKQFSQSPKPKAQSPNLITS